MILFTFLKQNLISFTTLVFTIGVMGTRPLVSLLSSHLGANPFEIGVIIGVFSLLPFFLAIRIGRYIDSVGYKKPIILSSFLCSVSLMIPLLFNDLIGVYISQSISGITQTIFVVAAQTMVSGMETDGETQRDKNIMKFSIGVALGSFIGPLIGGFIAEEYGYQIAFGILGAVSLLSSFLSFYLPPQPIKHKKELVEKNKSFNSFELLKSRNIRKAFLISILILLGKDIYTAYFPLLALEFGLTEKIIGIIIAINALAGILIRWSIPYLLKYLSKNKVIVLSIILSGVCLIILPLFSHWSMLAFISFILGIGLGIGQPMSISATIQYLPPDRVGEGLGLRLSANRFTQMMAPVTFGAIAEYTAMSGVFWIAGFILLYFGNKTDTGNAKITSF